jgi:hypothetical protein
MFLRGAPLVREVTKVTDPGLLDAVDDGQGISARRLAALLRVSDAELALVAGLPNDAISHEEQSRSAPVQSRLRHICEILASVLPWAGGLPAAYAWYRSQALPSFGDATAEELVRAGRQEAVQAYLSRIAISSFA